MFSSYQIRTNRDYLSQNKYKQICLPFLYKYAYTFIKIASDENKKKKDMLLVFILSIVSQFNSINALDNGLGKTPQMGVCVKSKRNSLFVSIVFLFKDGIVGTISDVISMKQSFVKLQMHLFLPV